VIGRLAWRMSREITICPIYLFAVGDYGCVAGWVEACNLQLSTKSIDQKYIESIVHIFTESLTCEISDNITLRKVLPRVGR